MQKIVKYGLESRARDLKRQEIPVRDIARILSDESGQKLSHGTVSNFFISDIKTITGLKESTARLKEVEVRTTLSTIEKRNKLIEILFNLAENAEHESTRVNACRVAKEVLESLDKRTGDIPSEGQVQINIQQNNLTIE